MPPLLGAREAQAMALLGSSDDPRDYLSLTSPRAKQLSHPHSPGAPPRVNFQGCLPGDSSPSSVPHMHQLFELQKLRALAQAGRPAGGAQGRSFSSSGSLPSLTLPGDSSAGNDAGCGPSPRAEGSLSHRAPISPGAKVVHPLVLARMGTRGSLSMKRQALGQRSKDLDEVEVDEVNEAGERILPTLLSPRRHATSRAIHTTASVGRFLPPKEEEDAAAIVLAPSLDVTQAFPGCSTPVGGRKSDSGNMSQCSPVQVVMQREESMLRKAVQIGLCKEDSKNGENSKNGRRSNFGPGGRSNISSSPLPWIAPVEAQPPPPLLPVSVPFSVLSLQDRSPPGMQPYAPSPLGGGGDSTSRRSGDGDGGTTNVAASPPSPALMRVVTPAPVAVVLSPLPAPVPRPIAVASAPGMGGGSGAAARAASGLMHSYGVSFKLLNKFANSVDDKMTTAEMVQAHIMPATAANKNRYMDILPEKHCSAPGYYLIHTWNCNFKQLVSAVELYMSDIRANLDDTFIWIDIFASNLRLTNTKEDLAQTKELIDGAEKVLFFLDNDGICLGRTWVQFELWQALSSRRGAERLSILHNPRWDWDQLTHVYTSMSIQDSLSHHDNDRLLLVTDMQRNVDPMLGAGLMRRQLQDAAQRDLKRTEKLASVNPKPYLNAALTRSVFLVMERHIKDAEDTLKRLLTVCDRTNKGTRNEPRDAADKDIVGVMIALARVQRLLGKLSDAESVLQGLVISFRGMEDEVYYEGMGMLASVLLHRRQFTKAEMLCRKIMLDRERDFGVNCVQSVSTLLQLADIAIMQRLHEEADEDLRDALIACGKLERGHPDLGRVKHKLAVVAIGMHKMDEGVVALEDALQTRTRILGLDHPETLETRLLQADFLLKRIATAAEPDRMPMFEEALTMFNSILKARTKTYGADHPSSLEVLGRISDVQYDMGRHRDGLDTEKRIMDAGRTLLKHTHVEKFSSLIWISKFLAKREHLLASAALFLARAYFVYKDKLGPDHEVTMTTRLQLTELATTIKAEASSVLRDANNRVGSQVHMYAQSELLFKQALQVSKLINPAELEHKEIARGLADSLFGQGKMTEGKKVMSSCGLSDKGGKGTMPSSYLRWFNKRVVNFLAKRADQADSNGGDADAAGLEAQHSATGFESSSDDESFL